MYWPLGVLRAASTTWSSTLPRAPGTSGSLNTTPTGGLYFVWGFFLPVATAATVDGAAVTDVASAVVAVAAVAATASSGASRARAIVAGTTRTGRIEENSSVR